MVIVDANGHGGPSSILDGLVCILHSANTLAEGMNQTILFPGMCKTVRQTGLFKRVLENENSEF